MFCPNCGAVNEDNSVFCGTCGASLTGGVDFGSGENPVAGGWGGSTDTVPLGGGTYDQPATGSYMDPTLLIPTGGGSADGYDANAAGGAPAGGYDANAGYGAPAGGYDANAGYGAPAGGYDPNAGYGAPAGGYDPNAGYGAPTGGYDPNAGYGQPAGGYNPNAGYGQQAGGYNPNAGYGQQGGGFQNAGAQVGAAFDNLAGKVRKANVPGKLQTMDGKTKKIIGIVAAAVVALIVLSIVLISVIAGPKADEKPLDELCTLINSRKTSTSYIEGKIKKILPMELLETAGKDGYYGEDFYEDIYDELGDSLQDLYDEFEDDYGSNYKMSYELRKRDDYSNKELKSLKERYEEYLDVDTDMIEDARTLKVRMSIKGKDDSDGTTTEISVIKVNGKWYLNIFSMGTFGLSW